MLYDSKKTRISNHLCFICLSALIFGFVQFHSLTRYVCANESQGIRQIKVRRRRRPPEFNKCVAPNRADLHSCTTSPIESDQDLCPNSRHKLYFGERGGSYRQLKPLWAFPRQNQTTRWFAKLLQTRGSQFGSTLGEKPKRPSRHTTRGHKL